jgi:heterogeneous nuclear ribonucleoprotein R
VEGGEAKRGSVEVDDTHQKGAGGSGEEDVYQGEEGRDAIHAGGKMEDSKKEGGRGQEEDPMARPPHGSEVFIGGITKDVVEDDLKELCANCGHIFEVCLILILLENHTFNVFELFFLIWS